MSHVAGNITYCGSSAFVFTPPHAKTDSCHPRQKGATMVDISMGYGRLAPTRPGRVRNVVFDGLYGIGPTGVLMAAHGLPSQPSGDGRVQHIQNLTLRNVSLQQAGGAWQCTLVDNVTVDGVTPVPDHSTCMRGGG